MARKPATASRLLAAALALLAAVVRSRAADADAAAPAAPAAAPESAAAEPRVQPPAPAPALPPIVRDPFWPVGFDPDPPPAAPVAAPPSAPAPQPAPTPQKLPEPGPGDWAAARRQLKPNVGHGVNPDGSERFFAFMNGRLVSPGLIVKVETPLFGLAWRIDRIDADGVAFTPVEARRLGDGARFAPPPTDK